MRVRGGGFLKEIRETARFAAGKFGVDKQSCKNSDSEKIELTRASMVAAML